MQLAHLEMRQTYAKIGLNITRPVQEIKQPQAELNMHQEPAILEIHTIKPQLIIDQSQAWAEMDLKGPLQRTRDNADYGREMLLEAIAQIAQEGDQMQAIESGSNAFVQIATDKSLKPPDDFNVAFIPSYGSVKIQYIPGRAEIHTEMRGVKMDPVIHKPEISYQPGNVEVYLREKNSLNIRVVGGQFDQAV